MRSQSWCPPGLGMMPDCPTTVLKWGRVGRGGGHGVEEAEPWEGVQKADWAARRAGSVKGHCVPYHDFGQKGKR